jgi:hypothetical protein
LDDNFFKALAPQLFGVAHANIREARKYLPETNTLAYFEATSLMKKTIK